MGCMSQSYPAWKHGSWSTHTPAVVGHWSRPALAGLGKGVNNLHQLSGTSCCSPGMSRKTSGRTGSSKSSPVP